MHRAIRTVVLVVPQVALLFLATPASAQSYPPGVEPEASVAGGGESSSGSEAASEAAFTGGPDVMLLATVAGVLGVVGLVGVFAPLGARAGGGSVLAAKRYEGLHRAARHRFSFSWVHAMHRLGRHPEWAPRARCGLCWERRGT